MSLNLTVIKFRWNSYKHAIRFLCTALCAALYFAPATDAAPPYFDGNPFKNGDPTKDWVITGTVKLDALTNDTYPIQNYYIFNSITIRNGGTLTIKDGQSGDLYFKVRETFKIENGGRILLSERGVGGTVDCLPDWFRFGGFRQHGASNRALGQNGRLGGNGGAAGSQGSAQAGFDGSRGGYGGDGGYAMCNSDTGEPGGQGGRGGNGGRGEGSGTIKTGGRGGDGGDGGPSRKPGAMLYIEARSFVIEGNGRILNRGQNGAKGSAAPGRNAESGGVPTGSQDGEDGQFDGGKGGEAHELDIWPRPYVNETRQAGWGGYGGHSKCCGGWPVNNTGHPGSGGGGGQGGFGAPSGGGGGGAVFIKAPDISISSGGRIDTSGGAKLDAEPNYPKMHGYEGGDANVGQLIVWSESGGGGGGGGGAGGSGGTSGRGADGPVVLIYDSENTPDYANLGIYQAPWVHLSDAFIENNKDSKSQDPRVTSYGFTSNLIDQTHLQNGWLNQFGLLQISTENGSVYPWLEVDSVQVRTDNTNLRPQFFDIARVEFGMTSTSSKLETVADPLILCLDQGVSPPDTCALSDQIDEANTFTTTEPDGSGGDDDFSYWTWFSQTPQLYASEAWKLFELADGVRYARIIVTTRANKTRMNNLALPVDQYAPCDDKNHICFIEMMSPTGEIKNIDGSTSAYKDLDFKMKFVLSDGQGSGILTPEGPFDTNLQILVARQVNNVLTAAPAGSPVTVLNVEDPASLEDRSCEELFGSGGYWNSLYGEVEELQYVYSVADEGFIIDSSTGKGANIRNKALALLGDCGSGQPCDGTLWVMGCVYDLAGNSTRLINENNTSMWSGPVPASFTGRQHPVMMAEFDSTATNYDHASNRIAAAYVPPLKHRIFVDGPAFDVVSADCLSDPCIHHTLSPSPGHMLPSEVGLPLKIAYNPVNNTNAPTVSVGIKLPYDLSGIRKVHYKLSNEVHPVPIAGAQAVTRPADNDDKCAAIIDANNIADPANERLGGWVDFCFDIPTVSGVNLNIWLEDNAGNINHYLGVDRRVTFVDKVPPSAPFEVLGDLTTGITTPTFSWEPALDQGGVEHYEICYWQHDPAFTYADLLNLQAGSSTVQCPGPIELTGNGFKTDPIAHTGNVRHYFQFTGVNSMPNGDWRIAVFAKDFAGNFSSPSLLVNYGVAAGPTTVDFPESNVDGGVANEITSSGYYTFKVRYTEVNSLVATDASLYIDLDHSGSYSPSEIIPMAKSTDAADGNDNNLVNGEIYVARVYLTYTRENRGRYTYKFRFANSSVVAIDGLADGNPTINNTVTIDSYDLNSFAGMMQVRNNVFKKGVRHFPTVLLKRPATNNTISVHIYDNNSRLVRKVLDNVSYTNNHRFVRWDLKNRQGSTVPSGIYNVVYYYESDKIETKRVIVVR